MYKWGFYGRQQETEELISIANSGRWFFCSISGRRRIGKTTLVNTAAMKSNKHDKVLYFMVPDSDERGVIQYFQDTLMSYKLPEQNALQLKTFSDMASYISFLCSKDWVVILDEFQYFNRSTLRPFTSFLQAEVDKLRDTQNGGLFVLGSIHAEMTAILDDQTSPLFNRLTHNITIDHWDFSTLFEMFNEHNVHDPCHQLFLWSLFEGVPKFYRDAFEANVLTIKSDLFSTETNYRQDTLRKLFFEGASPLKEEADNWFLRELRGRYDAILRILAKGKPCSHSVLKQEFDKAGSNQDSKQLGGFLSTLIEKYKMVERLEPIFAAKNGRKARYAITDNFLLSWLKALQHNVHISRVRPPEWGLKNADEQLKIVEGYAFEKMIKFLMEETSRKAVSDFPLTDFIKGYWNKAAGADIEIDIVALNEDDELVRFGSCKRSENKFSKVHLIEFEKHISRFLRTKEGKRISTWNIEKMLASPAFSTEKRLALEGQGYICNDISDYRKMLEN